MRARPLALVLSLLFVSLAHAQTPPPPAISTILPATGGIGTSVTITGSNFGSTQAQSVVTFNGISARVTTWSDTSIVAKAPRGLSPGSATIIVAVSQTASNGVQYTVTQPLFVTPNQATLSVGATRSTYLGHAVTTWAHLLDDLILQHMTVHAAVIDTNAYLLTLPPDANNHPVTEQWQVIGDGNVRIN
jgi:hypothetical protein